MRKDKVSTGFHPVLHLITLKLLTGIQTDIFTFEMTEDSTYPIHLQIKCQM
jgi:hypothetical protein